MQLMLTWIDAKIEFFPLIKPHFSKSGIVVVNYFWSAPRKGVRGGLSKNMAHMRASGNHQLPATHPDLKGKTITQRVKPMFWLVNIHNYKTQMNLLFFQFSGVYQKLFAMFAHLFSNEVHMFAHSIQP